MAKDLGDVKIRVTLDLGDPKQKLSTQRQEGGRQKRGGQSSVDSQKHEKMAKFMEDLWKNRKSILMDQRIRDLRKSADKMVAKESEAASRSLLDSASRFKRSPLKRFQGISNTNAFGGNTPSGKALGKSLFTGGTGGLLKKVLPPQAAAAISIAEKVAEKVLKIARVAPQFFEFINGIGNTGAGDWAANEHPIANGLTKIGMGITQFATDVKALFNTPEKAWEVMKATVRLGGQIPSGTSAWDVGMFLRDSMALEGKLKDKMDMLINNEVAFSLGKNTKDVFLSAIKGSSTR